MIDDEERQLGCATLTIFQAKRNAGCKNLRAEIMTEIAGWNVWARSEEALRKFSVACRAEKDAFSLVRKVAKGLQLVSREPLPAEIIADLDLCEGQLLEWAPIGKGARVLPGGTAIKVSISRPTVVKVAAEAQQLQLCAGSFQDLNL